MTDGMSIASQPWQVYPNTLETPSVYKAAGVHSLFTSCIIMEFFTEIKVWGEQYPSSPEEGRALCEIELSIKWVKQKDRETDW